MFERCLVVDDHQMIGQAIEIMLNSLNIHEVILAKDGAEAISKIYHHQPSLIITDLQMDPIDGLEMLRLVRSGRYNLPYDIPIIVLTSNAAASIIKECIAFDVDAFIVKPVNKQTLQNRIEKLKTQIKPKKPVNYYLYIYKQNPLKKIAFLNKEDSNLKENDIDDKSIKRKHEQQNKQKNLKNNTFRYESQYSYIKWQEEYSVGNNQLDKNNKNFLGIINEAYNLAKEKKINNESFENLAQEFDNYINKHFDLEENLLASKNYPLLNEHIKIHTSLKKKAEYVLLKCQADPKLYKTEFMNLIKAWWINHIMKEDNQYKRILMG